MLSASRRILRPGGRAAFLVIQPTPDLPPPQRRRANRIGPPAVAVPTSYPSLLRSAGFTDIETIDLTGEYEATQQRWIAASARHEPAMRAAIGDALFDERAASRRRTLHAIQTGIFSRFQYQARRPQRSAAASRARHSPRST